MLEPLENDVTRTKHAYHIHHYEVSLSSLGIGSLDLKVTEQTVKPSIIILPIFCVLKVLFHLLQLFKCTLDCFYHGSIKVLLIKISLIWVHSVCNIGHQSTSSDKLTYDYNIIAVNGGKMVNNVSCETAEGFLLKLLVCKASSDQVSHTGSYGPLIIIC